MSILTRRTFVLVACFALVGVLAGSAAAQSPMREFSGEVQKISKKFIIVDNRMGDKIKFEYAGEETVVEGLATEWKSIKRKQWVTVSSRMLDKPRVAYKVVVEEPRKED